MREVIALDHPSAAQPAAFHRWLSIIGIGEAGVDDLCRAARESIQSAHVVFGGARHLSLASTLIRGEARPWSRPFDRHMTEVLANRGRAVCVLASGDPLLHGVGGVLSNCIAANEMIVIPAPSAFSLAASRLLWPLQHTVQLSLCGRSLDLIRPYLHPGTRLLLLTSDEHTPAALARLLGELGFGSSQLTLLEALGGARERIRAVRATDFALEAIDALHTLAVEVVADTGARILPRAAGLADSLFEHDGQLTKREVRALTLSALAPQRGEQLWDVGAGSGSIAIEWMLSDASLTAIAIEAQAERAARIRRNAVAFGVPHLAVVHGAAPDALQGLQRPDAVFVGGGATTPDLIDTVQKALRCGGRLVVNTVSLSTEALVLQHQARFGGELTRIEIARATPIGEQARLATWRPAMPVMQWRWVKP